MKKKTTFPTKAQFLKLIRKFSPCDSGVERLEKSKGPLRAYLASLKYTDDGAWLKIRVRQCGEGNSCPICKHTTDQKKLLKILKVVDLI